MIKNKWELTNKAMVLYMTGSSVRQVAKLLGVSVGSAHAMLRNTSVIMRPKQQFKGRFGEAHPAYKKLAP